MERFSFTERFTLYVLQGSENVSSRLNWSTANLIIIVFPYMHSKIDARAEKELLTNNVTQLHNTNMLSLIKLCNQYLEIITC